MLVSVPRSPGREPRHDATSTLGKLLYADTTKVIVSEELLDDAAFGLDSYLAQEFGERIGVLEETAFAWDLLPLPAKPIVDVQVSVRDVEDEASYVSAIEELGVSLRFREPEHRYFRPAGDEPRTVQIHVCTAGGEWEREHLLFRDYLRAHPEARSAYARLKQELGERYRDDRLAYNEGKTDFVLDTLTDARAWAERTGWTLPPGLSAPRSAAGG
jgi:hypothetical protein